MLGLVGESGSGKTITRFAILALVDPPGRITGGEILFQGRDLVPLPARERRKLRGSKIAMIFQDPMMTLNPVLRVATQLTEALLAHRAVSKARALALARAAQLKSGIPAPHHSPSPHPPPLP